MIANLYLSGSIGGGVCANSRKHPRKGCPRMESTATEKKTEHLRALPGDDVRQIMWRFEDRFDLQMLVQSVRAVARGPVARLVAQGARSTHEWTPEKESLIQHFDESGITALRSNPPRAASSRVPRTWPWPWWPWNWPGWMPARPPAPGGMPGALAHPRARHPRAARLLHEPLRSRPAGRGPEALARGVLPHRADSLRRRRNRPAGRQGARRRMAGGPGAHPAGGEARPLHHQHGLRQFRHRRRGYPTTRASREAAW